MKLLLSFLLAIFSVFSLFALQEEPFIVNQALKDTIEQNFGDDAKGFFLCTEKDFIKRARGDAKFHLVKDGKFFVVRDITEHFVPMIGF